MSGNPGQVPPYIRRVCVDAWLRTRSDDHVSYYRKVMKYRAAAHGVEVAVGSRSYDQWLEFGQMQFDYLVSHGLKPGMRMLEIGCGNLRAGRLFIEHLDAGDDHSQLACELLEIPIETLERRLVADLAALALLSVLHGFQVTHIPLPGARRLREILTIPISAAVGPAA